MRRWAIKRGLICVILAVLMIWGILTANVFPLLLGIALTAFCYDALYTMIPNWLNLAGAAAALATQIAIGLWNRGETVRAWKYELYSTGFITESLIFSLTGLVVLLGIGFVLFWLGGLGGGDAKLFAVYGLLLGWDAGLQFLTYSILCSFPIAIAVLLVRKDWLMFRRLAELLKGLILRIGVLRKWDIQFMLHDRNHIRFPFMYAVLPGTILAAYIGLPVLVF